MQIDYILAKRGKLKAIKDCKVIPSEGQITQHRMLVMDMRFRKQKKVWKPKRARQKIRWWKLNDKESKEEKETFVKKATEELEKIPNGLCAEEMWKTVSKAIRDAAEAKLGLSLGRKMIGK